MGRNSTANYQKVTMLLGESQYAALRELAHHQDLAYSEVVRRAIDEYIDGNSMPSSVRQTHRSRQSEGKPIRSFKDYLSDLCLRNAGSQISLSRALYTKAECEHADLDDVQLMRELPPYTIAVGSGRIEYKGEI